MFDNVLVGIDGRQGGRDAIALARTLGSPWAEISLANVYGAGLMPGNGAAVLLASEESASQRLLEAERDAASLDAKLISCPEHSIGRGLHETAREAHADLLVVGSCHRGALGRLILGDDASAALNLAPCAVAIAPAGYAAGAHRPSVIGVGYDGSRESEDALSLARELAARFDARLKALAVVSLRDVPPTDAIPENWPEVAAQLMEDWRRQLNRMGVSDGDAAYGEPSDELAAFSAQIDLLIVGSRSYGAIGRLLHGSTSNYLARRARCPLLVLPRSAVGAGRYPLESSNKIGVPS